MKKQITKRLVPLILGLLLLLGACGTADSGSTTSPAGSENTDTAAAQPTSTSAPASASEAPDEATPTPEPTPEPTKPPAEYLEPAKAADPGHFSDPEAFGICDTYKGYYFYGFKETFSGDPVTLGVSLLKEHYTGDCSDTKQYADENHEAIRGAETLEAGAVGYFETNTYTRAGELPAFILFNPGDAPAAWQDCVIIGFENESAAGIEFTEGEILKTANLEGSVSETDPRETFLSVLGEPYEIDGTVTDDELSAHYTWRDESGMHILEVYFWGDDGHYQIVTISYKNFTFVGE